MKRELLLLLTVTPLCLAAVPYARAQNDASAETAGLKLEPPQQVSPNRLGLSYRMGFNTPLSFKNLGGYAPVSSRLTPSGDPYNYDDGYVYPNGVLAYAGVATWYWGYDAAPGQSTLGQNAQGQLNPVNMHRSSSQANLSADDFADEPSSGFEATYSRELFRSKRVRVGLEAAFGYTYLNANDSQTLHGDVTVMRDAYDVQNTVPGSGYGTLFFPLPGDTGQQPYQHGRETLGGLNDPLISDTPTPLSSQVIPGGATDIGFRRFSANLYGFRLGPYVEFPLSRKLAFDLSGGFALAYVESDFSFNETVTIAGVGYQNYSGSSSTSGWLPGGYVAGNFAYAFAENWAATAGAQFIDVGQYTHSTGGKQAVLDLSQSIFVTIGISHSF